MSPTRRDVLRRGWRFGGGLLAAAATWTSWEALRPLSTGAKAPKIRIGAATDYAAGTATYLPAGRLYVVNASDQLFALNQKCPHLGCRVPFCESSGRFECGCHGSVYDLAGEWVTGPAPRGMDRFEVTQDGDYLVVDTGKTITGPPHGEKKFLTPPKGPSCLKGA
jgi:Rieske Fe-S protein